MNRYTFNQYEDFFTEYGSVPEEEKKSWVASFPAEKLALSDRHGRTAAHEFARRGLLPKKAMTARVLMLKTLWGETVAHRLAFHGHFPPEMLIPEIAIKRSIEDILVAEKLLEHMTRYISDQAENSGTYFPPQGNAAMTIHDYFSRLPKGTPEILTHLLEEEISKEQNIGCVPKEEKLLLSILRNVSGMKDQEEIGLVFEDTVSSALFPDDDINFTEELYCER